MLLIVMLIGSASADLGLAILASPWLGLNFFFFEFFCLNLTLNHPARFWKRVVQFLIHFNTYLRGQMIRLTCFKRDTKRPALKKNVVFFNLRKAKKTFRNFFLFELLNYYVNELLHLLLYDLSFLSLSIIPFYAFKFGI